MADAYNFLNGSQTDINRRLLRKIEALEAGETGETADITALKAAVGADDTTAGGLKKRCKDIETSIGADDTTGLKKRCKDLETAIGDEDTPGTILARIKALEDAQ